MMASLKSFAQWVVGDYDVFRIYATDHAVPANGSPTSTLHFEEVSATSIAANTNDLVRAQRSYAGAESMSFACLVEGRIVGLCFYWYGERYRNRNYWPLTGGQAKLVQIVTVPDMRGRGVARGLISYSTARMLELGFTRLLARVWLTNAPSRAAFVAAGWRQIAIVVRINPLRRANPMRFTFGKRPSTGP
jgi:GNAT superfamily N-acetyltransferase